MRITKFGYARLLLLILFPAMPGSYEPMALAADKSKQSIRNHARHPKAASGCQWPANCPSPSSAPGNIAQGEPTVTVVFSGLMLMVPDRLSGSYELGVLCKPDHTLSVHIFRIYPHDTKYDNIYYGDPNQSAKWSLQLSPPQ